MVGAHGHTVSVPLIFLIIPGSRSTLAAVESTPTAFQNIFHQTAHQSIENAVQCTGKKNILFY